jgi:hypothetical protein
MTYVIKRTDGMYVTRPGSRSSYTAKLQDARPFNSRAEAERERCPANEIIVSVEEEIRS